jgi:hypothetical protein
MKKTLLFASLLCSGFLAQAQVVTTFSGTGEAAWSAGGTAIKDSKYDLPYAAIFDSKGNVWVSDENNNVIVLLNTSKDEYRMRSGGDGGYKDGNGFQIGTGGAGSYGAMAYPKGIVAGANDTLYIVDNGNSAIRRLTPFTSNGTQQTLKTIAGGGEDFGSNGFPGFNDAKGLNARFDLPVGIAISNDKTYLLIADQGNDIIRKVMISGADYGKVTTFAGKAKTSGSSNGPLLQARFTAPEGIFIDSIGNIYVAERFGGVRKISHDTVSTVVTADALESPTSVVVKGPDMYIADGCNIKHFNMVTKQLSIFAGRDNAEENACDFADGQDTLAKFYEIGTLTLSADKTYMLVADRSNNRIRKVTIPEATVGINEKNKSALNHLNVYPNPANQFITIEGNTLQNAVITMYDATGRKVYEQNVKTAANNYRIDVSNQQNGIYILQVAAQGNVLTKRIVVTK